MRSLLFVPADNERKLDKALGSGADALILDLEDSVAAANKGEARRVALNFLARHGETPSRPLLYVRVNGFASGLTEADLDWVVPGRPDGVVLPKAAGSQDLLLLDARLSVREALHGLADGSTRILAIMTETAAAMFQAGTYSGSSRRLAGLSWGAEDLSAEVGALATRTGADWSTPFQLARSLCLFGAAAAQVEAIDTVYVDFRDLAGLERECTAAARDGFSAKLAIHPAQVPVINAAFMPPADLLERAHRVVAAFAGEGGAGVISLDGVMLDRPHLRAAERLLARAAPPGSQTITTD